MADSKKMTGTSGTPNKGHGGTKDNGGSGQGASAKMYTKPKTDVKKGGNKTQPT